MNEDYPVYAKLTEQKLSQLGVDSLGTGSSQTDYVDPAWDYLPIFQELLQLQHEAGITIAFITDQENATTSSHAQLAMRTEQMTSILQSIEEKLKST